jgi:hypothetical protein
MFGENTTDNPGVESLTRACLASQDEHAHGTHIELSNQTNTMALLPGVRMHFCVVCLHCTYHSKFKICLIHALGNVSRSLWDLLRSFFLF